MEWETVKPLGGREQAFPWFVMTGCRPGDSGRIRKRK